MLDYIDQQIVRILVEDGRISMKDLAERVGMSSPSTSERIKRLEERGVIVGFTVDVDMTAMGYTLQAIVRIRPLPGKLHVVQQMIESIPEIIECDKVTGDDCFFARLFVHDIAQLDNILDQITDQAETSTSIVKLQPVKRRLPPLS